MLDNPIISKSYRNSLINKIKEKNNELEDSIELIDLFIILKGKKEDKPYIDFYKINREELNKEIVKVMKLLTLSKKTEEEKKKTKNLKIFLRSLKKI